MRVRAPCWTTPRPPRRADETLLEVNNIEVIYNHVILVLKGVSPEGAQGRDHRAAGRQWRGQDHDAEGDLEPAAFRARRGHQGHRSSYRGERVQDLTPPIW